MAEKTGISVAFIGIGALMIWSSIRNQSVLTSARDIITGKQPTPGTPQTLGFGIKNSTSTDGSNTTQGDTLTTVPDISSTGVGSMDAHAALQKAAALYGWDTGEEWQALNAIEMQEAGYDPTNTNPSSRAYGLAQSLGHPYSGGPAPDGIDEYGGEGLSASQSAAASSGDAYDQALWMVRYIKDRYGNPIVAEQFHLANNWY